MKRNKYLVSYGKLIRKENTVYFVNKEGKIPIPIEKIYSLYCFGSISFSSGVVKLLAKNGVVVHFFGKYGEYICSLYPKEKYLSGDVLVKQVEHYLDLEKRKYLAKQFVIGALENIYLNLKNYNICLDKESYLLILEKSENINEIMSIEANIRKEYYSNFDKILNNFEFESRIRNPPNNEINALISFGNSLLYGTVITEIYNTYLNPTVSFLHEPSDRRYSLALDIADIFKPAFVDRLIFSLVNKKIIKKEHFDKDLNCCLLNENGKKIFLKYFGEMLERTVKHKKLGKEVSYKRLIRLELYKLQKHILGIENYKPFVRWW